MNEAIMTNPMKRDIGKLQNEIQYAISELL